jgi:glyoxylase-like metal-dependent hydrolase (beta-lactamase superfamily II)
MRELSCKRFQCGPIRTNVYLITNSQGHGVLIDAAPGSFAAYQEFSEKNPNHLEAVLLTHGHWDHFLDAAHFQRLGIPVYVSTADGAWIGQDEYVQTFAPSELNGLPCRANFFVKNGDLLSLLGVNWQVIAVGGHSPGGISYYLPAMYWAFTGDSLFSGTIGRTDIPGGDSVRLIREIRERLLPLPSETQIFPGHGFGSTIGAEKMHNPYLRNA